MVFESYNITQLENKLAHQQKLLNIYGVVLEEIATKLAAYARINITPWPGAHLSDGLTSPVEAPYPEKVVDPVEGTVSPAESPTEANETVSVVDATPEPKKGRTRGPAA